MKTVLKLLSNVRLAVGTIIATIAVLSIALAQEFVPAKVEGKLVIASIEVIGVDFAEGTFTAVVTGTDAGHGAPFGRYTGVFELVVDFDLVTSQPLSGAGETRQTNADGSEVYWDTSFPVDAEGSTLSVITGGTGRFQGAQGWVKGPSILHEDLTVSYDHAGQITSIGSNRRAKP